MTRRPPKASDGGGGSVGGEQRGLGRVVGLVPVGIAELIEEALEGRPLTDEHLHATEDAATVGATTGQEPRRTEWP